MKNQFLLLQISWIAVLFFFVPIFGDGQTIQTNIKNPTVDYERLAKIDDVVNEYINKNWLTGAVSIIINDNK